MPLSFSAEVLLPRTEAAGVADAMIEANKLKSYMLPLLPHLSVSLAIRCACIASVQARSSRGVRTSDPSPKSL
jgi:hypothetical protein